MESDQPGSDGPSAHPLGSMDDGDISASGSLPQEPYFSASTAGVAGILRREQRQAASTDRFPRPPDAQSLSHDSQRPLGPRTTNAITCPGPLTCSRSH